MSLLTKGSDLTNIMELERFLRVTLLEKVSGTFDRMTGN